MHSDPRRFGHLCLYRTLQIHLFAYGTLYFLYPFLLVFVFLFLLHNHQPGNISTDRIDPKHAHESYSRLVMQPVLLQHRQNKIVQISPFSSISVTGNNKLISEWNYFVSCEIWLCDLSLISRCSSVGWSWSEHRLQTFPSAKSMPSESTLSETVNSIVLYFYDIIFSVLQI